MLTVKCLSLRKAALALGTMAVLGGTVASANPAAASHNPCHPAASSTATVAGLPCGAANPCAASNPCAAGNPCAAKRVDRTPRGWRDMKRRYSNGSR